MAKSYLDKDGLLYFLQSIRPNTTPSMDGTAATGSAKRFALQDHVHPTDTSRVPTTRKVNGKALSADITLSASDVSALPSSTVIPSPGTGDSYPTMNGARALGSNAGYARVDHVHPSDTNKVDKVSGKGLSTNDYTTAEMNKLAGIASGAEVNQNAFSNVKVGDTTVAADAKTDTLELVAGSNITLTPDATNDKVTIGFSGTIPTIPNNFGTVKVGSTNVVADTTSDTLELVAGSNVTLTPDATNDKVTIAATDTTYSDFTPSTTSAAGTHGLVPAPAAGMGVTSVLTSQGFKSTQIGWGSIEASGDIYLQLKFGDSGLAKRIPNATTSVHGLMSNSDKTKLDSLIMTNGVIDASNLPSYVDDVIEAYARSGQTALSSTWLATGSASGTVITPEAGKIYVLMADSGDYAANTQFRWGGTAYVKLSDGGVSSITNAEIDTIIAA